MEKSPVGCRSVVSSVTVPAVIPAVARSDPDGINTFREQRPESLRGIGIARKATGHADNGNRII